MSAVKFKELAESLQLKLVDGNGYGFIGDFPVVVRERKKPPLSRTKGMTLTFTLEETDKALKKDLNRAFSRKCYASIASNYLNIEVVGSYRSLAETYEELSQIVPEVFAQHNVLPMQTCPICQKEGCGSVVAYGKGYHSVHDYCVRSAVDTIKERAEDNQANGGYILGSLGGLAGGILACVPSFLTIWFMERAYSLLYILIPLGIYGGYKLMKGKLSKFVTGYTVVLSVILAVGLDIAVTAVGMISAGYPMELLPYLFRAPGMFESLFENILTSLLFVAIGIYYTWRRITHTSDTDLANAELLKETMIPFEDK